MLLFRKILFYLFAIIYCVFCPMIILQALGITFKSGSQSLQKTGIIYLSSIPSGAKIEINNLPIEETTPTMIRDLRAGQYSVRILKEDHKTWEKILPVMAEKATTAERILLIPANWPVRVLSLDAYENLTPVPSLPYLLLKKDRLGKSLFSYHYKSGLASEIMADVNKDAAPKEEPKPLFEPTSAYLEAKIEKMHTAKNSPFALLEVTLDGKDRFIWIDLRTSFSWKDVTALFTEKPQAVLWENEDSKFVYTLTGDHISRIDIASQAIYPQIIQDVRHFTVYKNALYVLTKDSELVSYNQKGENPQYPSEENLLFPEILKQYDNLSLTALSENLIFYLSENGALLSTRSVAPVVEEGVVGFQFDEKNKKLLVWSRRDLGTIDLTQQNEAVHPLTLPAVKWFNMDETDIRQAFWADQGAYIVYCNRANVFLAEAQSFGQPQIEKITEIKKDTPVSYLESAGLLFFIDAKTRQLSSAEIIEQSSLFSLPGEKHESPKPPKSQL